jgi:hypothetical protein
VLLASPPVSSDWHRLSNTRTKSTAHLKQKLSIDDFNLVNCITDSAYKKEFEKKKKNLTTKYAKLLERQQIPTPTQRPSSIKNPILQLQTATLPPEAVDHLTLGPKFAVTRKEIPYIEIITEIEKVAITLHREGRTNEAEELRHQAAHILKNAPPPKSNLTHMQKKGLLFLKRNKDIAVTPFDKGQGFCTLERDKLVSKAQAEFKNVTLDTPDTTPSFERKIQKVLRRFKKEDKLSEKNYKLLYPSGSITPSSSPAIKAHKQNKDYPARNITSHIGAPQEALASHLNDLLKTLHLQSPLHCKKL